VQPPLTMLTPDSNNSFNIRKNRERMIHKEAEKASHLSSSTTSQAAPPGGDGKLTHAMDNTLQRFLLKEGYNASDSQVLESARQRLRELVQSSPSHPEVVDSRPSQPEVVESQPSQPKNVLSRTSDEHTGHVGVADSDGDFVYLYDKDTIYKGGAPVPGRASSVERLTFYRHKSDKKFRPVPPLYRIPRMHDHHDDHAAELESLLQLVESAPSDSDFSETRRLQRKKEGRQGDESLVEDEDERDVEEDADSLKYDRKRGRPSSDQLAEVKAFEQQMRTKAGVLARKWGVSVDVIFDQAGFGGVAVKKTESLWNTFQKVGSVTVPANKDCMSLVFHLFYIFYLFILSSKSMDAGNLSRVQGHNSWYV